MAARLNTTEVLHSKVYFKYQSHSVSFQEWISIFTICLAPLVTHVVFGYADAVLVSPAIPHWTDHISQFNPLTILWRWYAIVYRRLRAENWDAADLAASNAIFWTATQWDGSEHLMLASRDWLVRSEWHVRKRVRSHASFVSGSSLATAFITLQGVSAMMEIAQSTSGSWHEPVLTLPHLFYPLAILSFLRLPASMWLTRDYRYNSPMSYSPPESLDYAAHRPSKENWFMRLAVLGKSHVRSPLDMNQLATPDDTFAYTTPRSRLGPPNLLSRLWAGLGILLALAACVFGVMLSVTKAGPRFGVLVTSSSSLCVRILYFTLSLPSAFIFAYYAWRGHATNTALPCMNLRWYKEYSALLIAEALVAFIMLALETTILPDGTITTYSVPL